MNVIRDQFPGRRQNKGAAGQLEKFNSNIIMKRNSIAPRAVNFRIRNQGVVSAQQPRQISTRTPSSSSSNCFTNSTRTTGSSALSSAVRNSAVRSSGGSRQHQTPRTPRSATINESETNCIVALAEGRGQARGEVGLAAIDIKRPNLFLCQLSDNQTYTNTVAKINVFNPVEVLLPNTLCEGTQPNKLVECIREQYPQITITTVQRRHFNDANGILLIQKLCAPQYSGVQVLVSQRFYSLAATAALLKYVEFIQNMVFAPRSLRIQYQGSNNTMLIDVDTAQRLELVRGTSGNADSMSLLGTLSMCRTVGGSRLLRASLLQPPCLPEVIVTRFDCVQEIVNSPELYHNMQAALSRLSDCEQLLALSMAAPTSGSGAVRHAETQLNYVLLLKSCLESLPQLAETLKDVHTKYLCELKEKLEDAIFEDLREHICEVLHDDAHTERGFTASSLQRCFAVRSGVNGLLDVARKTYCELVDDITDTVNKHKEETGLPMRVGYNSTRGFHIQIPITRGNARPRNNDLPPSFIQINSTRSIMTLTTQKLIHTDQRCKETLTEIYAMSNVVISELLSETRQHAGSLYQMCEAVSQLDMMMCLASVSSLPGYVRPTFGSRLDVKASRHPILTFLHHTEPVANDIIASEDKNFHIITGPNMGGKSIYLRQVALLQILAQVGCFVPAASASFRICDRIFSRIGFDDSIECNASTFAVEIREMALVLRSLTPRSLVIVDELCRGTSSEEGTSVAWALCERLLDTKAFTFFATHFLFLTKLQDLYPNVLNHHLKAEEKNIEDQEEAEEGEEGSKWIEFTHRLVPGVTNLEKYGLRLAELSGMPSVITKKASELLQSLAVQRTPVGGHTESSGKQRLQTHFSRICYDVSTTFQDCVTAEEYIKLQTNFLEEHPNCLDSPMTSSEIFDKPLNDLHKEKKSFHQETNFEPQGTDHLTTPAPYQRSFENESHSPITSTSHTKNNRFVESGQQKSNFEPEPSDHHLVTPVASHRTLGEKSPSPIKNISCRKNNCFDSSGGQETNIVLESSENLLMTSSRTLVNESSPINDSLGEFSQRDTNFVQEHLTTTFVTSPTMVQNKSPPIICEQQFVTGKNDFYPVKSVTFSKSITNLSPEKSAVLEDLSLVATKLMANLCPEKSHNSPTSHISEQSTKSPMHSASSPKVSPQNSPITAEVKSQSTEAEIFLTPNGSPVQELPESNSECFASPVVSHSGRTCLSPQSLPISCNLPSTSVSPPDNSELEPLSRLTSQISPIVSKPMINSEHESSRVLSSLASPARGTTSNNSTKSMTNAKDDSDPTNLQLPDSAQQLTSSIKQSNKSHLPPIKKCNSFQTPTFKYPLAVSTSINQIATPSSSTPSTICQHSETATIPEEYKLPTSAVLALPSPVFSSRRANKRARVSGLKPFQPPLRKFIPPIQHLKNIETQSSNEVDSMKSQLYFDKQALTSNSLCPSFYKFKPIQQAKAARPTDDYSMKQSDERSRNNSPSLPLHSSKLQESSIEPMDQDDESQQSPSYSPLASQASSPLSETKSSFNISHNSSFCKYVPETRQKDLSNETKDESQTSPTYSPLKKSSPISFDKWFRLSSKSLYD